MGDETGQSKARRGGDALQDLLDGPGQVRVVAGGAQKDQVIGVQCVRGDADLRGGIGNRQPVNLVPFG